MTRTRSEYRLVDLANLPHAGVAGAAPVADAHRDAPATPLLAAYRDTIDDEGEDLDDARDAIDHYLGMIVRDHSIVVAEADALIAMSFVVVVDGVHYIDPSHKRRGIGRACVVGSRRSMADAGLSEVGATITDGNTASEQLFRSLGFERTGGHAEAVSAQR